MTQERFLQEVIQEVLLRMAAASIADTPCAAHNGDVLVPATAPPVHNRGGTQLPASEENSVVDITSPEARVELLLRNPQDADALLRLKRATSARIGIGRAGPRMNTRTLLTLRADHASARDSVMTDVDEGFLKQLGLFSVQTRCRDRDQHITRPDLGRQFDEAALKWIEESCTASPQIQVYASDGLSSRAVEANLQDLMPALEHGLGRHGVSMGTPFFVKYGRVPAMDVISETLDAQVTCVLIGERPGLATANSLSAYIAYRATVGMPEARRTVVSNIHAGGILPVEAGAWLADLLVRVLEERKSGVDLKL